MTAWVLVPCLEQLFAEFDRIAPRRNKASDGKVGDTAHQQEPSDHNPDETGNVPIHDADKINEVHAGDVTAALNAGDDLTMEKVVQFLLARCRSGAEKRLRYIIYNRRIWSASSGWVQKTYTGKSPHTEHAHFSASYVTALEASRAPYHLEVLTMAKLDDEDRAWIGKELRAVVDDRLRELPAAVFAYAVDRVNPQPGQSGKVSMGAILQFLESNLHAEADRVIRELAPADPPPAGGGAVA